MTQKKCILKPNLALSNILNFWKSFKIKVWNWNKNSRDTLANFPRGSLFIWIAPKLNRKKQTYFFAWKSKGENKIEIWPRYKLLRGIDCYVYFRFDHERQWDICSTSKVQIKRARRIQMRQIWSASNVTLYSMIDAAIDVLAAYCCCCGCCCCCCCCYF